MRSARRARAGGIRADVRGRGGADEVVTVRFENGEPVVEPGSSGADIVIETDPATLFCGVTRAVAREAIGAGAIRDGQAPDAERFLSLFSFDERESRELEHV